MPSSEIAPSGLVSAYFAGYLGRDPNQSDPNAFDVPASVLIVQSSCADPLHAGLRPLEHSFSTDWLWH
jgi:hypothetical protein